MARQEKTSMFRLEASLMVRLCVPLALLGAAPLYAMEVNPNRAIYVDAVATGRNDGSSWGDACNYLQDALATVGSESGPVEVRVAQGVYRPDQGIHQVLGDRGAAFHLINAVVLKGGYAGLSQSDPNAWNPIIYETVFWGDLGDKDDLAVESTLSDNSRHLVTASGVDESAVLEGVTITRGAYIVPTQRAGWIDPEGGAGIYNRSGSPTIVHCTFTDNVVVRGYGAAMFNWQDSAPRLRSCTFRRNYGTSVLCNIESAAVLTDCHFVENDGDAVRDMSSRSQFDACSFTHGGSLSLQDGSYATLSACSFTGNHGAISGSSVPTHGDSASVWCTDCTFAGNVSEGSGGAVAVGDGTFIRCRFRDNRADIGGAIRGTRLVLKESSFTGNSARWAGAVECSEAEISGCLFVGNRSDSAGALSIMSKASAVSSSTVS